MKRSHLLVIIVTLITILAGCSGRSSTGGSADGEGPSAAAVRGKSVEQALELANEWKGNGVTTYVTTQEVNFEFADGATARVKLPRDKMVVAIAPYVDNTHPCEIHYMSGCQGELVGVPVAVQAMLSDGTVVVDETMRTMANGFIELWLPRDENVSVRLAAMGKSVSGTIGTHDTSNTCITTLQLL